jgi:TP901 family phage tail tape measure protein
MATLDTILNIEVKGTDSMVKLKNAIDNTADQLKQFKKEGQQTGETLKQYQAKVVTAETKLKGLRGELTKSKTELLKTSKAVSDTSKSYDSLVKQNAVLSQQLRKLPDPLGKNKKQFEQLSGQMKKNTDQLKQMDGAMGRNQRNVGNYGASITKLVSVVGGAILAFQAMKRAIGVFVDFEFQIKQVGIISGATAEEMALLEQQAKDLGSTTAFSAGEVAGFQKELAKLGFDPTQIQNMTESALDLAFAFDIDLATAGESIGGVLKSFNLDASESTRVTDVLAKAFSASALDMDKFNTAFPKVGAVANTVGFELEGVVALMGNLADKQIDASVIGTSLKNIMLKLADESSDLAIALGGSVTSADQLIPALQDLQASGIDVTEMLELTDQRSVTAFATLLNGADDVEVLNDELLNAEGTAKSFADAMRDTLKGSLDEAKSSAEGFMIELIDKLQPAITLVVDGITALFGVLSVAVENFGKIAIAVGTYVTVTTLATARQVGFTTALGATRIGQIAYRTATVGATVATRAFSTAIKANPIGLLVSGLALGVSALADWGFGSDEATDSTEDLNAELDQQATELTAIEKIRKKAQEDQTAEIARLQVLQKEIKNSNKSLDERKKALDDFNKLAGTNISNLEDETRLAQDLEKAYDNAVDAIKRKIILQSTEDQVTELLKQQIDLEKKLNDQKEKANNAQVVANRENDKFNDINDKRVALNLRSNAELIDGGNNLKLNNREIQTQNEIFSEQIHEQANLSNDRLTTLNYTSLSVQKINNDFEEQANTQETLITNDEDRVALGLKLTEGVDIGTDAVLNQAVKSREATENLNEANSDLNHTQTRYDALTEGINKLYSDQSKLLANLKIKTSDYSGGVGDVTTQYGLLKDAVTSAEKALAETVTNGEIQVAQFLASEKAKEMSVEERASAVAKIEEDNATKIETATNNVINAKNNLLKVEDKLDKQQEKIDEGTNKRQKDLQKSIDKTQEQIDADKEQLSLFETLEDDYKLMAEERIRLALKIAKAELDLALKTAQANKDTTKATLDNIATLIADVEDLENKLDKFGDSTDNNKSKGFLQDALFGSDPETGEPFTGQDLIDIVNTTFSEVNAVLDSMNALQQQRLQSELATIQGTKLAEVREFEKSAEAEMMTEEEKAETIEKIEAEHDDAMLKLKVEQFKKDQQLNRAQALMSGAQAIMNILAGEATKNVIADAIIKAILIAGTVATTATQIAMINAQKPPTAELGGIMDQNFFAQGGMVQGRSHAQGGEKFAVGGRVVELEGGEAVINKRSTAMFKPMLSKMNVAGGGRKFADGGLVFNTDVLESDNVLAEAIASQNNEQQVILVEADVTQSQKTVKNIESRITF